MPSRRNQDHCQLFRLRAKNRKPKDRLVDQIAARGRRQAASDREAPSLEGGR
jgi:hypothetical protein